MVIKCIARMGFERKSDKNVVLSFVSVSKRKAVIPVFFFVLIKGCGC